MTDSFDHVPPRAATYWRELAERASRAGKYYRTRSRELSRRVGELEAENRALQAEKSAADFLARQAVEAHRDAITSLKRLRVEIDYLKAVARDLKAVQSEVKD